jgi:stage II sporulation protein D
MIPLPIVKVRLPNTARDIVMNSKNTFLVLGYHHMKSPTTYFESEHTRIMSYGNGMVLFDESQGVMEIGLKRVTFIPGNDLAYLHLNGKPYRGILEVIFTYKGLSYPKPQKLMILNIVNLEDYLKGVVPAEIGSLPEAEIEAVKAQSVAARTYAISRLDQYEDLGYDLEATVKDQVYNGVEGEDTSVSRAIESTAGLVLTRDGEPIDAYYHANCGGMTEYIERVWDKPPEPYLVPVADDYCHWAEKYSWEESWSRSDLEENLTAYLDTLPNFPVEGFGNLVDLNILQRSPSGRVEVLEVVTDSARYEIYRDRIRWALRRGSDSSRILPGTLFDLEIERDAYGSIDRVRAVGNGSGHGVGMCQTGIIGRARQGLSLQEILTNYYTNVKLSVWGE